MSIFDFVDRFDKSEKEGRKPQMFITGTYDEFLIFTKGFTEEMTERIGSNWEFVE